MRFIQRTNLNVVFFIDVVRNPRDEHKLIVFRVAVARDCVANSTAVGSAPDLERKCRPAGECADLFVDSVVCFFDNLLAELIRRSRSGDGGLQCSGESAQVDTCSLGRKHAYRRRYHRPHEH